MSASAEQIFLDYSLRKLLQLAERIDLALTRFTAEQLWTRANAASNAPGNLVLHLCGNVTQWVIAGVGNTPDQRDRDAEFAADGGYSAADLQQRLAAVVAEAASVLRALPPERLTERVVIQGHELTVLEAVYHVVEHFSGHTGQLLLLAKAAGGEGFGFYSYLQQKPAGQQTP
jgi:uncharacterized damage-inducible protein DinB